MALSKLWTGLLLLLSASAFALELSPLRQPPYTGDLDVIKEKNVLRVLVSADLGFYYIEGGEPKGIGAELLAHFERDLRKLKPKINIQIIPVSRDELLPSLEQGWEIWLLRISPLPTHVRNWLILVILPLRELKSG